MAFWRPFLVQVCQFVAGPILGPTALSGLWLWLQTEQSCAMYTLHYTILQVLFAGWVIVQISGLGVRLALGGIKARTYADSAWPSGLLMDSSVA